MLAAVLVLWGGIAALRRKADESGGQEGRRPEKGRTSPGGDIDLEELERAEREVRDLDVMQKPEDGFEGDDWGPGSPRHKS
jgi:hypothetical protein